MFKKKKKRKKIKNQEKDITGLTDSTMLCQLGPKVLAESENFSGPLKMMMSASILSESPLKKKKKGKKPRTKVLRFSVLFLQMSSNINADVLL